MTTELAIPDPRSQTVPRSWWEEVALPAIAVATWEELDEMEARLLAFMSYIEAMNGDALEFAKALRCVEARRGELLATRGNGNGAAAVDESASTQSRWRKIADNWETLEPVVRDATRPTDISQARLLRIADGKEPADHPISRAQRLENAITKHRDKTLAAGHVARPFDYDLWGALDG